jgi:xanthine dehydrogenase YagR molybdenum-binding subunit
VARPRGRGRADRWAEIGIVGTAAAIANAVSQATGKRVRQLPITPDKLL